MSNLPDYQGIYPTDTDDVIALHFIDNYGPLAIFLPTAAVLLLCGRALDAAELRTVMLAHVYELFPLVNSVLDAKGDFTIAMWESGVPYRRLNISLDDVKKSSITLSIDVLATARNAGYADPRTGVIYPAG